MAENGSRKLWEIIEYLIAILVTINTSLVVWCLLAIVSLQADMAAIKANRFTNADGLEIWKSIAIVREQMAKIPTEVPPKWFVEKVDKIEERQQQMSASLARIEARQKDVEPK